MKYILSILILVAVISSCSDDENPVTTPEIEEMEEMEMEIEEMEIDCTSGDIVGNWNLESYVYNTTIIGTPPGNLGLSSFQTVTQGNAMNIQYVATYTAEGTYEWIDGSYDIEYTSVTTVDGVSTTETSTVPFADSSSGTYEYNPPILSAISTAAMNAGFSAEPQEICIEENKMTLVHDLDAVYENGAYTEDRKGEATFIYARL